MNSQGDQPSKEGKPPPLLYVLPRLKLFAPGQPLYGKLTYIKLDDPQPPAFNLFDLVQPGTREQRFAAARRLMHFNFSSEFGSEFSGGIPRLFNACPVRCLPCSMPACA